MYSDIRIIFRTAGAVILRISHGYEVQEHKDPFVTLANTATEQFSLATSTGQFMVDCIPARKPRSPLLSSSQSILPLVFLLLLFDLLHPRFCYHMDKP